nr:reverse transcriptase domain-containing protein [Tanacetum cinerariifolium]
MLERLAENEYYYFLDGFSGNFQIPIDPQDQEKTTFTCPYERFAYRRMPFGFCNAPGTFQRCMMAIFHDMIEETMEVLMDDFSVFRNSFSSCLSHLDKTLQRCKNTNLVLNWEKCHFMVKEGIVLGHKISKSGIEVDKAKVDVIAKLPPPTSTIVYTDHSSLKYLLAKQDAKPRLLRWILLLQEFNAEIHDKKVAENLAADHLSRLESPLQSDPEKKEITETFPFETLVMVTFRGDSNTSWFIDIANYLAGNFIVKDGVYKAKKPLISLRPSTIDPPRDIMVPTTPLKKSSIPVSIGRQFIEMPMTWSHGVTLVNVKEKSHNVMRCLKMQFKFASLTYGASTLWARSHLREGTSTFSWPLTTCQNGLKQKRSPLMMPELFVMLKYGVTHRLSIAYHPQTSGQVEVSNRGLKRILERTVGENSASWSDKLDDALWAFRTTFKTHIGCTPYKLVYEKSCHLPIELEHKAYWALKHCNFDLKTAGDHQKVQMNELNKLRDQAYENSLIYKEKTKKIHDSKIRNRVFNVGDRVLPFNSRLNIFSGKLKTRWTGPFTITQVFPYSTVELPSTNGSNFKVNGHRLKHYFGGDIPPMVVPNLQTFPIDN